ncbi:peptidase domain-containing ABC transporter [Granulosicoccus antarcticus]|uniref:Toxin RTX-I translocation ATP-binding protein n=1 Tax=Granulosicoccus antarcticus IMCC3135 TaxID=1192854 RepID=A0A2Z2NQI7_9GAMM|nr:peptidase domain-containing ABC transporter [Granulosicoccus antarcticus]ASJ73603.1 Toxin RTX-I translocation ATP-binding protein [Granulosicoccus antarcticus IMCC3135]
MAAINMLEFVGGSRTPIVLQNEANECGLACLVMIACHHGYKTDLASLHQRNLGTARGARLSDLMQTASQLKLAARPVKADLDELNKLQLPAILHWDFNHYVVLTRVGQKNLEIHDPGTGKQSLSLKEMSKHYTGIALEVLPEADFVAREERRKISLRHLLGRIQGLPKAVTTIIMLALALEVFTLAAPLFMQLVVDSAIVSNDKDLLTLLAIGFLLLSFIQVSVSLLRGWVIMVISNQLNLQLLSNLFRHLVRLPMIWFERRHLGDVISRFDSMGTIQTTLTGSFLTAMIDGLMVITTFAMMMFYAGSLSAVVVVAALSYALVRLALYRPLRQAQEEAITRGAKRHTHFLETARGIQSIKLFGRQILRRTQYESLMVDQFNAGIRVQRLGLAYQCVNGLIFSLENIVVVWIAGVMILDGRFSVGMLFAFLAYKQQFISRTTNLIEKGIELKMLSLHTERVADIALSDVEPERHNAEPLAEGEMLDIRVSALSYRYSENEEKILDDFSMHISPGECVALVGPSGCGKTTLVKLLLGLLPPECGDIFIGGQSLEKLDLTAYRNQVGTVMQDDQLFAGSISDNITFFDPTPDMQLVQQVANMAAIHREIVCMPLQYHSMIGDMGSVLSGGQKQRLLLARALYKRPRILVLDEATSHLDVAGEKLVSSAVMQLPVTRIIIAHRPETIASADRVIEMQIRSIAEIPVKTQSCVEQAHSQFST